MEIVLHCCDRRWYVWGSAELKIAHGGVYGTGRRRPHQKNVSQQYSRVSAGPGLSPISAVCSQLWVAAMASSSASPATAVMLSVLLACAGNHASSAFMLQSQQRRSGASRQPTGSSSSHLRSSSLTKPPTAGRIVGLDARLHRSACRWGLLQQQDQRDTTAAPLLQLLSPQRASRTAARLASSATATTTMSAADQISPGSMVVFESEVRGRPPALGLVTDTTVSKKKSTFTVQPSPSGGGNKATVAPRQVRYVVPGGSGYQATDLAVFEEQPEVDEGLMEEAWDMMLEESAAVATAGLDGGGGGTAASASSTSDDPRGMAELLFGVEEPTPQQCYQAFCLLEGRDGTLYFKRRRDGTYECRTR